LPAFHLLCSSIRLPDRVAFSVSGVDVYWYGVFLAVGILSAIVLAHAEVRRLRLDKDTAVDICLLGIPLGIIGARLGYVFSYFSYFKGDPLSILYVWDGGLSAYGAAAGVLLGLLIYSLVKRVPILRLTDVIAPGLVLAQGVARWGDFFNQQGYGPEVTNDALQWFPFAVLIEKSDTIHYAVFFYEFLWCAFVFAVLWFVVRKRDARVGTVTLWYLLLYSLGHAAFSLLRVDSNPVVWKFSLPALVFAALFLLALALLIARRVHDKRGADASPDAEPSDADSASEHAEQPEPGDPEDDRPAEGDPDDQPD